AAAEAGAAGHEVVLLERQDRLGGQVALAGAAPMHAELARTLARNYQRLLAAANVEIRLEAEADSASVAALAADAVIIAAGARAHARTSAGRRQPRGPRGGRLPRPSGDRGGSP